MKTITKALLKVQSSIRAISKNKENKHFGYSYVEINAILKNILPILSENKLFLHQSHEIDNEDNFVTHTILLHESGESIKNESYLKIAKTDPQSMGGLHTYGRRYGLVSLLGLQAVDNDAHDTTEWKTDEQKTEYQELLKDPYFDSKRNDTNKWFKEAKTKEQTELALDKMKEKLNEHHLKVQEKLDEETSDIDNKLTEVMED